MNGQGNCPYTRSGRRLDGELTGIVEESLKIPTKKCPNCNTEGVVRGWGEVTWRECPKCGK